MQGGIRIQRNDRAWRKILDLARNAHPADSEDVTTHLDLEYPDKELAERPCGNPRRRFARTRAFQDVPCVVSLVFQASRQISVPRARPRQKADVGFGRDALRRHGYLPMS